MEELRRQATRKEKEDKIRERVAHRTRHTRSGRLARKALGSSGARRTEGVADVRANPNPNPNPNPTP